MITDERTITYFDSPESGIGYVGVAKKPLQQVAKGFGYLGVLIQTPSRDKVQCHICGVWLKRLSGQHLHSHKTTEKNYREQYGLLKTTPLIADQTSWKLEVCGKKKARLYPKQQIQEVVGANLNQTRRRKKVSRIVEHQNKHGICNAQLPYRLKKYLRQYKTLPSRSTKGEGGLICKSLHRKFGSINKAFAHYGLPVRYRRGTNVELRAVNNKQLFYNYNKPYSKEDIYQWILNNSDLNKLT